MKNEIETNVSFIQYLQPQLEDGNYSITVTQQLHSDSGKVPDKQFRSNKGFVVQGERFSINPDLVLSVFPPPYSLGEFYNVLPHVVLAKETLPWERSLNASGPVTNAPWMGVVVFDEDDGVVADAEKTVIDLLAADEQTKDGAKGQLPPKTFFPAFPKRQGETWCHLEYGESWSDNCSVIDVPAVLFNKVMPTISDLEWLAHARSVETIHKSESYLRRLGVTGNSPSDVATVAEVIGNRFPQPAKRSMAYLVSFEGFGDVLPGENGESKLPSGTEKVRLLVFRSWTFDSISDRFSFSGLLQKVNKPNGVATLNTLQLDPTGITNPAVEKAFNLGFTAFSHHTRMSDKTVSWYRGPLAPYDIKNEVPLVGNTADQFTRYNPDTAMLNVSYSAAWQLGRLLALQDNNFSTALYNWKRILIRKTIRLVEKGMTPLSKQGIAELMRTALGNYATSPMGMKGGPKARKRLAAKIDHPFAMPVTMPGNFSALRQKRLSTIHKVMSDHRRILSQHESDGGVRVPEVVTRFLARIRLLYGVPFNYIVPDPRMLPQESLRFFYTDDAWINALEEGAMSIARSTTSESAMDRAMVHLVHREAHRAKGQLRRSMFSTKAKPLAAINTAEQTTGFLLRSQVVEGWPGMEVFGFDALGAKIDLLRSEQVGPGILYCLFNGVVNKVFIKEEAEALHFGVHINENNPRPDGFYKGFRYVVQSGEHQPGEEVKDVTPVEVKKYTRTTEPSVVKASALAAAVKEALREKISYTGPFTSAEFALEMVEGVLQVNYEFAVKVKKAKK